MAPSVSETAPVFQLRKVSLSFLSGARETHVLHHLNFEVARGENIVIIGPSGGGKTVLLKVLAGLIAPDSGECRFLGEDLFRLSPSVRKVFSRRIGMTFQRGGLFDSMNVFENLDFPMRELLSLSKEERKRRITQALNDVGLSGREALQVEEMSGGMQKRLSLARTLVLSPEVLLCDDPTAGLDPITSRSIVDLMLFTKEKYSMTFVTVTSDLHVARALSIPGTRIAFLHRGDFLSCEKADQFWQLKDPHPILKQFVHGDLKGPLTEGEGLL